MPGVLTRKLRTRSVGRTDAEVAPEEDPDPLNNAPVPLQQLRLSCDFFSFTSNRPRLFPKLLPRERTAPFAQSKEIRGTTSLPATVITRFMYT